MVNSTIVKATIKELRIINGSTYIAKITPCDTFSVCNDDYCLCLEDGKVTNFELSEFKKDFNINGKEIFDFISVHQNGIFKFEFEDNKECKSIIDNTKDSGKPENTVDSDEELQKIITGATLIC